MALFRRRKRGASDAAKEAHGEAVVAHERAERDEDEAGVLAEQIKAIRLADEFDNLLNRTLRNAR